MAYICKLATITMGLDIIQGFDIEELDDDLALHEGFDERNKYELSRTFCNFMRRQNVVEGEADLDQIGRICGIDISPLYEMERYMPSWEMEEYIEIQEEEDPEKFRKSRKLENKKFSDNIDRIIDFLNELIPKLERISDLSTEINNYDYQTIHFDYYRNLDNQMIGNYIDNNLTQDLRNLLRYTLLARSQGAKTTFFTYG